MYIASFDALFETARPGGTPQPLSKNRDHIPTVTRMRFRRAPRPSVTFYAVRSYGDGTACLASAWMSSGGRCGATMPAIMCAVCALTGQSWSRL